MGKLQFCGSPSVLQELHEWQPSHKCVCEISSWDHRLCLHLPRCTCATGTRPFSVLHHLNLCLSSGFVNSHDSFSQISLPSRPLWYLLFGATEEEIKDICVTTLKLYTRKKVRPVSAYSRFRFSRSLLVFYWVFISCLCFSQIMICWRRKWTNGRWLYRKPNWRPKDWIQMALLLSPHWVDSPLDPNHVSCHFLHKAIVWFRRLDIYSTEIMWTVWKGWFAPKNEEIRPINRQARVRAAKRCCGTRGVPFARFLHIIHSQFEVKFWCLRGPNLHVYCFRNDKSKSIR